MARGGPGNFSFPGLLLVGAFQGRRQELFPARVHSALCYRMLKRLSFPDLSPARWRGKKNCRQGLGHPATVLTRLDLGLSNQEATEGKGRAWTRRRLRRKVGALAPPWEWARLGPGGQRRRSGGPLRRGCAGAALGESCG